MEKPRFFSLVPLLLVISTVAAAKEPAIRPSESDWSSFIRVQRPAKHLYQLQISNNKLVPLSGKGPVIWLTGVIHIGDSEYYEKIQEFLDQQELVLFEGVGGRNQFTTDEEKISHTRMAVKLIGALAARYHRSFKKYPESIDDIRRIVGEKRKDLSMVVRSFKTDGWERPLIYSLHENNPPSVVSLGADGKRGGKGVDADIEEIAPVRDRDIDSITNRRKSPVIDLAHAMKLSYQLESINYDRKNFVRSDVSMQWIREKLRGNSALGNVEAVMGGGGLRGVFVKLAVGLIKLSPKVASSVKLVMLETFGQMKGMPKMGGDFDRLMDVILDGRNEIVAADLKKVCKRAKPPKSVAVFYGAAHMPQLQKHIIETLGYKCKESKWLTAFSMDTEAEGLSPLVVNMVRDSLKSSLDKMNNQKNLKK